MSNRTQPSSGQKTSGLSMVLLLLLASLTGLMTLPAASASESGDVALIETISPLPDSWGSSWDPMSFEVTVANQGLGTSTNRATKWYVCEGDVTGPVCKSSYDARAAARVRLAVVGGVHGEGRGRQPRRRRRSRAGRVRVLRARTVTSTLHTRAHSYTVNT